MLKDDLESSNDNLLFEKGVELIFFLLKLKVKNYAVVQKCYIIKMLSLTDFFAFLFVTGSKKWHCKKNSGLFCNKIVSKKDCYRELSLSY